MDRTELAQKTDEYRQNFKKLAQQFYEETGLCIDDVSFGYPMYFTTGESFWNGALTNIRVSIR
jgi:hypothetical protein